MALEDLKSNVYILVMVDSDWAGESDRKSRTGYLIYVVIGSCNYLVVWSSGKQSLVTKSSAEAEIVAMSKAMDESRFIRNVMVEIGYGTSKKVPTLVLGDNEKTIQLLSGTVAHQRTRHIDIHYKSICGNLETENVHLRHVPGVENMADILTKSVDRNILEKHCNVIFRTALQ